MTQQASYKAAGLKPDKANAAKLNKRPDIVMRIEELQREATAAVAPPEAGYGRSPVIDRLWKIAASNEPAAARVAALKVIGEVSGETVPADRSKVMGDEDLLRAAANLGPTFYALVRMILVRDSFSPPPPVDLAEIEIGLSQFIPSEQLVELGQRLSRRTA